MGRPTTNPMTERISIRATKEDKELLEKCCKESGMTQHNVIMEGVRLVYSKAKK